MEGKVYEEAKKPCHGKTHPNSFGRQDEKRCTLSLGEQETRQNAFQCVISNHLIQNLCLDPKGVQTTEVMNTHEPNAALWTVGQ